MKSFKRKILARKIIAKYKQHRIALSALRVFGRIDHRRKWLFEVVITKLHAPHKTVLKKKLVLKDDRPIDQVMTVAFVDSLVLCDSTLD